MKKVNWKTVLPQKLSDACFWKQNQSLPVMDDVFTGLTENFSLPNKVAAKSPVAKTFTDLHVLETSRAQNLLILIRAVLKSVTFEQIKMHMLQCNTTILNERFNEGLIKCLPKPNEMQKLQQMKKDGTNLSDIEDFVASLLDIGRLVPRLECLNFKIRYDDMILNVEPDIKKGIAACKEVVESTKFKTILSVVLSIGNFLNSGQSGSNNRALGFELSILPKLNDIKTTDKKSTLLEYMVQIIKTKFPEVLNFGTELVHVKESACSKISLIEENIQHLSSSSEMLKQEVENRKVHQLHGDKFVEVMSPFSSECSQQVERLEGLFKQLQQSYMKVGEVFAFDIMSYSMEECFSNIRIFEDMFKKTYANIYGNFEALSLERHDPVKPPYIKLAEWNKLISVKV